MEGKRKGDMCSVAPLLVRPIVVLAHFQALVQVLVGIVHVGLIEPPTGHRERMR